jgi:molybdopterin-guanine dinucleotide biosynthesis protein A
VGWVLRFRRWQGVKVVILAGGVGSRLSEEPKPMSMAFRRKVFGPV